jgi:acyl carrier protein
VARGYLNNKELTDAKFVQALYSDSEKMYRTGDLAKWLPDGNVEFLGRMDNQVKIRGFRIELGEIENHLCDHDDVKEAVVLVKEREGDRYLVAYYVSDQKLDEVELRAFLSGKLAGYMVPAYYVRLERIPLTGNGKLDKKALPDPDLDTVNDDAKPINDTQKELVKIWSEVLDVGEEKISVNRNFFHIGGDSLKLIRMVDKINRRFDIELTVADMFKFPMISLLARFLNKENEISSSVEEDAEKMNHAFELYNQIRE